VTVALIEGIGGIADRYDLFLLDQWGVLHNGEQPHPAAVAAVRRLRENGKRIIKFVETVGQLRGEPDADGNRAHAVR
jgi:hypothetical protein